MVLRHRRPPSQHHKTDFSLSVRITDVRDVTRQKQTERRAGEGRNDVTIATT